MRVACERDGPFARLRSNRQVRFIQDVKAAWSPGKLFPLSCFETHTHNSEYRGLFSLQSKSWLYPYRLLRQPISTIVCGHCLHFSLFCLVILIGGGGGREIQIRHMPGNPPDAAREFSKRCWVSGRSLGYRAVLLDLTCLSAARPHAPCDTVSMFPV